MKQNYRNIPIRKVQSLESMARHLFRSNNKFELWALVAAIMLSSCRVQKFPLSRYKAYVNAQADILELISPIDSSCAYMWIDSNPSSSYIIFKPEENTITYGFAISSTDYNIFDLYPVYHLDLKKQESKFSVDTVIGERIRLLRTATGLKYVDSAADSQYIWRPMWFLSPPNLVGDYLNSKNEAK